MPQYLRHRFLTGSGLSSVVGNQGRRSLIVSIQRGTVVVASGTLSNTATITSVDMNNSRLRFLGMTMAGGGTAESTMMAKLVLTNATTITANINSLAGSNTTLSYEITQYVPGVIKSIQRGTVAGNTTATITSVDTTKTEIDNLGSTTTGANTNITDTARLTLTNATTVTGTSGGGATGTISYQVVEFY